MSAPPQQKTEVREVFSRYLRENNQRQTPERFAILEEVYDTDGHFDAETLCQTLMANGVAVSRATVYNTLDLLVECDLVVRHQFGGKHANYERAYAYWQHDHALCESCGDVFEFCDPRLQSVRDMIGDIYNFEVRRHALTLYGLCSKCRSPA